MSEDEVSIINKITHTVNESEIKILFEKQSCKMKQKFICMYKDQMKALEVRTAEMEKKHLELSEKKTKMESTLKTLQQSNEMSEQHIICLKNQLASLQNTFLEKSKKSKEDIERMEARYNEQIRKYESLPLAVQRQKSLDLKNKYSTEVAELDAKLQFYKRNLEYLNMIHENEMSQQIIRLAKYFKDKKELKLMEENLRTKEAEYMSLLIKKEEHSCEIVKKKDSSDCEQNEDSKLQSKLNLMDIAQLELTSIRQSPQSDEDITTQNNVIQSEQNKKPYYNQVQNYAKVNYDQDSDDKDSKKSDTNLTTSSFWRRTSDRQPVMTNNESLEMINENNLHPEQIHDTKYDNNITKTQKQENYSAAVKCDSYNSSQNSGNSLENNFKKVQVIENVVLKDEEVHKILDKLPEDGGSIGKKLEKACDVIIQSVDPVITNGNAIEFDKTANDNQSGITPCNEAKNNNMDVEHSGQITKINDDKGNNVAMQIDQEQENGRHNVKQASYSNGMNDNNLSGEKIKDWGQTVSKFFPKNDEPPKDDAMFVTPAAKKTKVELTQYHNAEPKKTNFINDIEMELQAFNTQTSYYGDTLQSLEYDNTLDSEGVKSPASYILSPEMEAKPQKDEANEKKDTFTISDPATSTTRNFFSSIFGGDIDSKKQPAGFNFLFGTTAQKPDEPEMPLFFHPFKQDQPQKPSQSNTDKSNKQLFFF